MDNGSENFGEVEFHLTAKNYYRNIEEAKIQEKSTAKNFSNSAFVKFWEVFSTAYTII